MVHNRKWASTSIGLLLAAALAATASACASRAISATAPQQGIPATSPLAKIHEGMGMKEVADLIGQPNDTSSHVTGKAFIPFYFGADRAEVIAYYKGKGRVIYSAATGSPRVSVVEYDPTETGYTR